MKHKSTTYLFICICIYLVDVFDWGVTINTHSWPWVSQQSTVLMRDLTALVAAVLLTHTDTDLYYRGQFNIL